jgi:hypothetical protein
MRKIIFTTKIIFQNQHFLSEVNEIIFPFIDIFKGYIGKTRSCSGTLKILSGSRHQILKSEPWNKTFKFLTKKMAPSVHTNIHHLQLIKAIGSLEIILIRHLTKETEQAKWWATHWNTYCNNLQKPAPFSNPKMFPVITMSSNL